MALNAPFFFKYIYICRSLKLRPLRTVRKEFINAKYVDHKYARKTCTSAAAKMIELFEAVQSRDLLALIQVYAEGVELMEPLPEVGPVSGLFFCCC